MRDELADRRIIRLLSRAADDVAPLDPYEVRSMLRAATSGTAGQRRRAAQMTHNVGRSLAVAATAAVVIGIGGVVLGTNAAEQRRSTHEGPRSTASLVSFEGTALQLLLSNGAS